MDIEWPWHRQWPRRNLGMRAHLVIRDKCTSDCDKNEVVETDWARPAMYYCDETYGSNSGWRRRIWAKTDCPGTTRSIYINPATTNWPRSLQITARSRSIDTGDTPIYRQTASHRDGLSRLHQRPLSNWNGKEWAHWFVGDQSFWGADRGTLFRIWMRAETKETIWAWSES